MRADMTAARTAQIKRDTAETKIKVGLDLDIEAHGDLQVDAHHTVEDVGICFGKALTQALGDKAGIRRYGSATLPMDETLVTSALDLSGRAVCVWSVELPPEVLGTFNAP